MNDAGPPTVIMMLKAPRPGTVKTRLAQSLGNQEATSIYKELVERQLRQLPEEWPAQIHYSPAGGEPEMREWLGSRYHYQSQSEGDLGERLHHASMHAFAAGAAGVIFLGGDCPAVNNELLRECSARMEATDVVIGPATDGGYYLLGLKKSEPRIFEEISWSTPTVLAQTLARLREKKLTWSLLPELEDVDDLHSWERSKSLLRQSASTA